MSHFPHFLILVSFSLDLFTHYQISPVPIFSDLVLDSGLGKQLALGVARAPGVGQLRRPPLPGLEVYRRPDHVEEAEHDEAHVLQELALAVEEDPEDEAHQGRHSEGPGVVTKPREVKRYLDPEIFRYLV